MSNGNAGWFNHANPKGTRKSPRGSNRRQRHEWHSKAALVTLRNAYHGLNAVLSRAFLFAIHLPKDHPKVNLHFDRFRTILKTI
jgi:hypothetical protein